MLFYLSVSETCPQRWVFIFEELFTRSPERTHYVFFPCFFLSFFLPFFPPFFSPCKLRANGNYSYNNDSSSQFNFVHNGIYKPWKAYAFHSVRKKCEQRWFWNWVMIALSRLCSQHQKDVRSLSTVCFQLTSSSNIFHVLKRHKILRDTSIPVQ